MHVSLGHQYVVISEMTSYCNPSQDLKLGKALQLDDAIGRNRGEFQKISMESEFKGQCDATNWTRRSLKVGVPWDGLRGGPPIFLL